MFREISLHLQCKSKKFMEYDISKPIPQGSNRAQDKENTRIAAISDELSRLCAIHEAQLRVSQTNVDSFEIEQRIAEQFAKSQGFWIPMTSIFDLGIPGPSGNENDTYVADNVIYKVNNLLNCGSIRSLLNKLLLHNTIFPDTAYTFYGLTGFDGRTIQPVIAQPRIANAQPATQIMIDTYMAALGFEKLNSTGRFSNSTYEVWDLLPRNVLIDCEGDIFVVDAEIKFIGK